MIQIDPNIRISATIKFGSVYYFQEDSFPSDEPHYFVVLNENPYVDEPLVLVSATSKVEKRKNAQAHMPAVTLVEVSPQEYSNFTVQTLFDCNSLIEKTKSALVKKLKDNNLKVCTDLMPENILVQLVNGVVSSPMVRGKNKKLLPDLE